MIRRLAPLLLALAACGGGGGGLRVADEAVVSWRDFPDGRFAYTQAYDDAPTTVEVDVSLDGEADHLRAILIHELVHVTGYFGHLDDPDCYLNATVYVPFDKPPCPQELEIVVGVERSFRVAVVGDYALWVGVSDAAAFWNEWVGREVFDLTTWTE